MTTVLESLELHPVRIPMRHRFRRIDHREALVSQPHSKMRVEVGAVPIRPAMP